jgi:hypothetical protein
VTLPITFLLEHYLIPSVYQLTEAGRGEDFGRGGGGVFICVCLRVGGSVNKRLIVGLHKAVTPEKRINNKGMSYSSLRSHRSYPLQGTGLLCLLYSEHTSAKETTTKQE